MNETMNVFYICFEWLMGVMGNGRTNEIKWVKWNQMSQMNEWMSCGVEMKQKQVSITNIDSYGNQ